MYIVITDRWAVIKETSRTVPGRQMDIYKTNLKCVPYIITIYVPFLTDRLTIIKAILKAVPYRQMDND